MSIGDYGELTFGGNYTIFMVEKAFKVVNDQNFVLGSGNEWHWTNNSSTVRLELTDNDNNLFLTVKDQGSSANFSFNSGQMFLDASGALGLGTTNPGKKMDIVGDINLSGTVFVGGGGIGVGNTGSNGQVLASNGAGGLQWTTPGGATYYANNGLNMSGTTVGLGGSLIQNTQIGTSSFGLSFLGLGGSKALYIGSNGKVGVGTTDLSVTSAVLTVKGDLDISGSLIYGGSPVWWVYGDTDVIFRLPSGGGTFKFLDSNNQTLLTMLEDVGIGIGTTDPKYDLDVVGNGHFSGALGVGGTVVLTGLVKGVGTSMVYIDSSGNLMAGTLPLIANDKTIILSPEYAGASLSADGSGTTAVSMTSDNTLNSGSVGWKNYYQLSSAESSLQDYSVLVRVTLPSDFNSWQTGTCPGSSCALEINYQTGLATTADNFISAKVTNDSDTPGSEVCSIGSTASTSWSSSGCASTTLDDGAAPEWDAAGETVVIRLKLGAKNTSNALTRVGDIILRYKSKF